MSRPRFDLLAARIKPAATWDDLALPAAQLGALRAAAEQVRRRIQGVQSQPPSASRRRGLGAGILFTGPSGTGKTMAAEVLAGELRLDLYRIDLSQVVSKYIGETEKNLARVFDAAENSSATLFFDEADALFGRRSEVAESRKRYAEEIRYFLSRMKACDAPVILSAGTKSSLPAVCLRKIRAVVRFPPTVPELAS